MTNDTIANEPQTPTMALARAVPKDLSAETGGASPARHALVRGNWFVRFANCALAFRGQRSVISETTNACQKDRKRRYFSHMSIAAEKVAEVLALPERDRAFLARQLIASLDDTVEGDAETLWQDAIDRRSREIEEGKVSCRPVEQVVQDIRNKLHTRRQPS